MTTLLYVIGSAAGILLAALVGWAARRGFRAGRRVTQFLDDWDGEKERPGVPARPGVMTRLQAVEQVMTEIQAETRPNGGHSLRDVVHEIRADIGALRSRIEYFERERGQK